MKFSKHACVKLSLVGLMVLSLTACGSKEEAGKVTETTVDSFVTEEIIEVSDDKTVITVDEAIALVSRYYAVGITDSASVV